jgi:hypothetical protein
MLFHPVAEGHPAASVAEHSEPDWRTTGIYEFNDIFLRKAKIGAMIFGDDQLEPENFRDRADPSLDPRGGRFYNQSGRQRTGRKIFI